MSQLTQSMSLLNLSCSYTEHFHSLPALNEEHLPALLYLSEAFSQDGACDFLTAAEEAILFIRMVLGNHCFVSGLLGGWSG